MAEDIMAEDITLLCGGVSAEHEISLLSAKNILPHLLADQQYMVHVIYLSQTGAWYLLAEADDLLVCDNAQAVQQLKGLQAVAPSFGAEIPCWQSLDDANFKCKAGTVIPILHGSQGEDGCVQGLLELMQVPYVGAGVLGSAITMDKGVTKQLLTAAAIDCVPWHAATADEAEALDVQAICDDLGLPLIVKPSASGSSLGMSVVKTAADLLPALQQAWRHSDTALIEPKILGCELECSVLAALKRASVPGEIITDKRYEFYDYQAKYEDENAAQLIIPAHLDPGVAEKISDIAWAAACHLRVEAMARVDFFLSDDGKIYVNEVNSIPGFTEISMYSMLWQEEGVSMGQLLQHLLEEAKRRHLSKKSY